MLIGSFNFTLDSKNRVSIPAKFRKSLDAEGNNKFYINRGVSKCIEVYPAEQWKILMDSLTRLNSFNAENAIFKRVYLQNAAEVSLDGQSRLLLPTSLIEFAGIEKDAFILGAITKIEIWNPAIYNELVQQQAESFEQIAEKVMGNQL
ncbi:MAG: division/cell wall cluster transcriptional repressor MraZ [Ignavibacteriales bacterium]|nr:MAG: division/cell wall cluster transcriptional repressor MraZ [Ignavibacteriales bacterium]